MDLAPAPEQMPAVDLQVQGAPVIRLLDMLDSAELDIAQSSVEHLPNIRNHNIREGCKELRGKPRTIWHCPLPVELAQLRYAQKPDDLHVLQSEEAIPYQYGLSKGHPAKRKPLAWSLARGGLVIASEDAPVKIRPHLVFRQTNASQEEKRLNLEYSGLEPSVFVRLPLTKGLLTRESLLLPAPSRASFSVHVPPQGQLRFGFGVVGLAQTDEERQASMSVSINGDEQWQQTVSSVDDWDEATIDLEPWADQTIQLTLQASVRDNPTRAYAAFASPAILGSPSDSGPRRVVVVGLDTLRPDHLQTHGYTQPNSPGMQRIAQQSVVFRQNRAPAPRTRPSFRTATTGRWPLPAIEAPTLGDILQAQGFTTAGFVANVQLSPRLGFADGYGLWSYDNMSDADVQVDRVLKWMQTHQTEDSAVFLHLMDPHIFYLAPEPFRDRFTADHDQGKLPDKFNRWNVTRWFNKGELSDSQINFIKARYDGEIAFMDREILRLVHAMDQMPGQTLFVFHSDHGEEFFEHGAFEHNHSLYDELVRTVLWIRPPGGWSGGPHMVDVPTSLVDLVPTVLDLLDIPTDARPPTDGTSLAPFVSANKRAKTEELSQQLKERPLHLGYLMLDKERWAVVTHQNKYILHTITGQEERYDLATDPGEHSDLAAEQPEKLGVLREALSQATGWPVEPGWRIQVNKLSSPLTLQFAKSIKAAGVIDPEADRVKRSNLEWGERPPVRPEDVATVTVSKDAKTVTFVPGSSPTGTLYIQGPGKEDKAEIKCGRKSRSVGDGSTRLCSVGAKITSGTIMIPLDSEAARLRSAPESDVVEALQTLGYIE